MAQLPPEVAVGERLKALTVNGLRTGIKENRILPGRGIRLVRNRNGTTVALAKRINSRSLPGRLVVVLNNTGGDLPAWAVSGIEKTTAQDDLASIVAEGIVYVLRKPEDDDKASGYVILSEAIKDDAVGLAYISGEGILARVKFDEDGSEDDLLFCDLDTTKKDGEEQFLYPTAAGSARILDREDDDIPEGWRWVVVRFPVGGVSGVLEDPQDLTYAGEHEEAARAPTFTNADGIDVMVDLREPEEDTQGFKITESLGSAYFDTGDEIFYQYVADYHYDSAGKVVFIEAERRVIVDVPEECEPDEAAPPQQMMGG